MFTKTLSSIDLFVFNCAYVSDYTSDVDAKGWFYVSLFSGKETLLRGEYNLKGRDLICLQTTEAANDIGHCECGFAIDRGNIGTFDGITCGLSRREHFGRTAFIV